MFALHINAHQSALTVEEPLHQQMNAMAWQTDVSWSLSLIIP
jgi:hypothetical protein